MPRRVQDILPGDKRSIRDIPADRAERLPARKSTAAVVTDEVLDTKRQSRTATKKEEKMTEIRIHREEKLPIATSEPIRRMGMTPPPEPRKSGRKRVWLIATLAIVVLIAGAAYVASTYFAQATFTITPKSIPVSVNGTYVIPASGPAGTLVYDVVAVHGSASTTVAATDGPQISTKAQGRITLNNEYSADSVRLIAGTRLADAQGRVYRLSSSVVIPGYSKSASGSIAPGTISTTVIADDAGASYNISRADDVSDFKIVAYKGTSKYESVYGRLAGDITGGFTGAKKTVAPSLLASTTATLRATLTTSLLEQVKKSIPAGYIMYPSSYVPSFSPATLGGTDKNSATVGEQGTLYGIVLKQTDLVARIAGAQTVSSFGQFGYKATGIEALDFSIANIKDFSPANKGSLIAHVKGDIKLVGAIPVEDLKRKLAGASLADTQTIFATYGKVIENGSGELAPPWSKIPTDLSRIHIHIQEK